MCSLQFHTLRAVYNFTPYVQSTTSHPTCSLQLHTLRAVYSFTPYVQSTTSHPMGCLQLHTLLAVYNFTPYVQSTTSHPMRSLQLHILFTEDRFKYYLFSPSVFNGLSSLAIFGNDFLPIFSSHSCYCSARFISLLLNTITIVCKECEL